ncbi:MAG: aldo/keto reductase [Gemmatimonadota bacterium]|nr:MAG: aldo/keto reductase [Gemmatimonadota bacterium]
MKSLSRREFSTKLAAGVAGAMLGCQADKRDAADGGWTPQSHPREATDPTIQHHNTLGRTGIRVSDVILGGGDLHEPGVIRYAFDRGVNVFDTAATYVGGVSEDVIGRGLLGVRDRAHIITKQGFSRRRPPTQRSIANLLEASLRRLQTDYVDGLFIHSMEDMRALQNDAVLESFVRFKQEGKVLFTGFSTHNERRTLVQCLQPRYDEVVDVVMFRYNHMEGEHIEPMIQALRTKGIGTIAMKTLAGGKHGHLREFLSNQLSYPQAAIGWALANNHIDCAVLSMDTYALVDAYVSASGKQTQRTNGSVLRQYRELVDNSYCRVTCTACEDSCPHQVAISDIMRCHMYYNDYRQRRKATAVYSFLPHSRKPLHCPDCSGPCADACPYGISVRERLIETHEVLAV